MSETETCAARGCPDPGSRDCYGARFCSGHGDELDSIRKELQLAKKRKKIYLEHHMRLHEATLRGIDDRHGCRVKQLEDIIIQRQGSVAAAVHLFTCRLQSCRIVS